MSTLAGDVVGNEIVTLTVGDGYGSIFSTRIRRSADRIS